MNFSIMAYTYLVIFIIDTALHLYASLKKDHLFRSVTKGIILLSILGFYLECVSSPSYLLITAILLSWLGDLFLIPHGVKWFTIGGLFFMISHVFFILTYSCLIDFSNINIVFLIVLPLLFMVTVIILFKNLKPYLKKGLFISMFFYLLLNGTMNCFAIFRCIGSFGFGSLITAIGAILFFVSDSSLFFVRFNPDGKLKTHFLVMLTYSLGEFLIVLGLIL